MHSLIGSESPSPHPRRDILDGVALVERHASVLTAFIILYANWLRNGMYANKGNVVIVGGVPR